MSSAIDKKHRNYVFRAADYRQNQLRTTFIRPSQKAKAEIADTPQYLRVFYWLSTF
jgi:hypothetical protein